LGKNPSPTSARDCVKIEYISGGQPSPYELAFGIELSSKPNSKTESGRGERIQSLYSAARMGSWTCHHTRQEVPAHEKLQLETAMHMKMHETTNRGGFAGDQLILVRQSLEVYSAGRKGGSRWQRVQLYMASSDGKRWEYLLERWLKTRGGLRFRKNFALVDYGPTKKSQIRVASC